MENLLEAIKTALASDPSDAARIAGAQACRTILIALETPAGETLAASSAPVDASAPLHAALSALRGMPADQLLDLAIARLKAALPPGTDAPAIRRLQVPIVELPTAMKARTP